MDVITSLDNDYEIIDIRVFKEKQLLVLEIEEKYKCVISAISKAGILELPLKNEPVRKGDRIVCTVKKFDKKNLVNAFGKEKLL